MANGKWMTTTKQVKRLEWYIQGHTFCTDMMVLDLLSYDAILGFDWLKLHSPMQCDWQAKTLKFQHKGQMVSLQGLTPGPLDLNNISAKQVYKSTQGNDIWAYVIIESSQTLNSTSLNQLSPDEDIQHLLTQYADVFQEPNKLPPQRSYDHAVSLYPDAVPINSRPYHYSPMHKTEIERQVK